MHGSTPKRSLVLLSAAGGVLALVIAFTGSILVAAGAGMLVLCVGLIASRAPAGGEGPADPGRRRFIAMMGGTGLALVAGGAGLGRELRRLVTPNPRPEMEEMARGLGAEALELVRRGYHPDRSGDLQLLLAPFSSSNYAPESLSLAPKDPRTSHAAVWPYLERVPIAVYAPGIVRPGGDSTERVTLADLAPTTAALMGFEFDAPDGTPLPGIDPPARPPKVIVTFVIDGGGWNVLADQWPEAWPNMKRLFRDGTVYRNAIMGSFPAVTASAHATIGTGAFPRTHGISGHNVRRGDQVLKAYGVPGRADPSFLLAPTLADTWNEHTGDRAWVGEIGYQIWHLGMLGRGGHLPLGDKPVAVYWDEDRRHQWAPQNPDLYRLPRSVPPLSELEEHQRRYRDPRVDDQFDPKGDKAVCCTPPIIRYQGDLVEAAFESEPIGADDVTDLLYINHKAPDYTGHVYNMLSLREKFALQAVDEQLGRLVATLERRFAPGEFVLMIAGDHGQCPTPDVAGGVRLDPIQLTDDIRRAFGRSVYDIVSSVVPSEVYLESKALWDSGVTREDVAAFLKDYRYRDNIGPYVHHDAIEWDHLDDRLFAAVLPTTFIGELAEADLSRYGAGSYSQGDMEIPPITW